MEVPHDVIQLLARCEEKELGSGDLWMDDLFRITCWMTKDLLKMKDQGHLAHPCAACARRHAEDSIRLGMAALTQILDANSYVCQETRRRVLQQEVYDNLQDVL